MTDANTSKLIEALALDQLSPEEQEALLLEINEIVFKGSMTRLIESMDESTREEFAKLMESDADDEQLEAFISARVPNADKAVAETVQELSDDILAITGT